MNHKDVADFFLKLGPTEADQLTAGNEFAEHMLAEYGYSDLQSKERQIDSITDARLILLRLLGLRFARYLRLASQNAPDSVMDGAKRLVDISIIACNKVSDLHESVDPTYGDQ